MDCVSESIIYENVSRLAMFRISVREEHASGNVHGQPQVGLH